MSYPWGSLAGCQGRRSQLGAAAAPAGGRLGAAEAGAADPSNAAAAGASDAPTALASVPAAGASVEAATHALGAALGLSPGRSATLASVFGTLRPGGAAPPRAPPPRVSGDGATLSFEKQTQYRDSMGPDAPFGWDTFSGAITDLKYRAPRYGGFTLKILAADGSADKASRSLEEGTYVAVSGKVPPSLNAYGFSSMVCTHAGEAKPEGDGVRASSSRKIGCHYTINMSRSASASGDQPSPVFILNSSVFEHSHPVLESKDALLLRSARFIPPELKPSLQRLVAARPALTENQIYGFLLSEAKEKGLDVTWNLADVRQAAYVGRGNHACGDAWRAIAVLKGLQAAGKATFDFKTDAEGHLEYLVWMMDEQVRALGRRGLKGGSVLGSSKVLSGD